jgi:hypothetical protein
VTSPSKWMHQWVDGMLNINDISKSTKGNEGIDGRNELFVPLIRDCCHYKTLCVTCPFVLLQCVGISSFCSVIFLCFSFDVLIFSFFKVLCKFSFKVSS